MNARFHFLLALSVVVMAAFLLGACSPQTVEVVRTVEVPRTVVETVEVEREVEVVTTVEVAPTPEPIDRRGAWLDQVVVVEEPSAQAAVSRLNVGEIDIYAFTVSEPDVFQAVQENSDLIYSQSVGSYKEITFNPAGPVFEGTGKLNPFAVPRIREAVNYLVDRNFIVQEIKGGLGNPKFFPIVTVFPDYARYAAKARELEARYAYNPDLAAQIISEEMEALGAEMTNGNWQFEGEPVELIFLIRTEDERREIGDYVANQLESVGFTVVRDFKTSAEAAPIWSAGDPNEGQWHLYTGGWISTLVSRDDAVNFGFFHTSLGLSRPLWQAYTPSEEFEEISTRLWNNDFSTLEERGELFERAMELVLQDSVRVWLVDDLSFTPSLHDVEVTADLSGAVAGSRLWPYTLRRTGEVGGAMTVAMPSILTQPWNAVGGSNWIYDQALVRATSDYGFINDPYTGLVWPQRGEKAEITVKDGLPVVKTLDWLSLDFAASIEVPEDAWIDWDATAQQFITVGEQHPDGLTANLKSVVTYPTELYETKWHDGSTFDIADVVMYMIMVFDQSKEDSAIFDQATLPAFEAFQSAFKGFRITSEDPLVVEYYTDNFQLDAELTYINLTADLYPSAQNYGFGPAAWHSLAVGILAEANGELAFSESKSDAAQVEQTSYIAGPSLEILNNYLDLAVSESHIPYAPTLSQYITEDEAAARWTNYQDWNRRKGHFWIGTGPYYLEKAFPVEGTVILRHNPDYPDAANKWSRFGTPRIAAMELDGPGRVDIGQEAVYDAFIDFDQAPYPSEDISEVKYLVFDANGRLAAEGVAEPIADGHYQVTLSGETTSQLEAGANRLEVVVVPRVVSIPTFQDFEFVTVVP